MGWVVMAMIGTGILLIALLLDTNWKVGRLSTAETRQLIAGHPEAKFSILQYQSGNRHLWIRLQENSRLSKFTAPADEATLALLAEKGIACPTYVQGRDFEILGWSGRLLPALCIFTLAAGAVLLLRWSGKKERKLPAPAE
jgi:hypothetical protein